MSHCVTLPSKQQTPLPIYQPSLPIPRRSHPRNSSAKVADRDRLRSPAPQQLTSQRLHAARAPTCSAALAEHVLVAVHDAAAPA